MAESIQSLETIRQKEVAVTRRLAAARRDASAEIYAAEQKATAVLSGAAEAGRRAGESEGQALLAEADREEAVILAQAQVEAERWRNLSLGQVETAAADIFLLIIGQGAVVRGEQP